MKYGERITYLSWMFSRWKMTYLFDPRVFSSLCMLCSRSVDYCCWVPVWRHCSFAVRLDIRMRQWSQKCCEIRMIAVFGYSTPDSKLHKTTRRHSTGLFTMQCAWPDRSFPMLDTVTSSFRASIPDEFWTCLGPNWRGIGQSASDCRTSQ